MRFEALTLLLSLSPALGGLIPSADQFIEEANELLWGDHSDVLSVTAHGGHCTLKSKGPGGDDTDSFLAAVKKCGKGGVVHLPDPVYTISRPIEIELEDSTLDVHGFLTFTTDVQYWIDNRIEFPFQNQSLAFVISGRNFTLEGNDKGGIDGNGQAWYDYAKDYGNKFGRPMSLAVANATDVIIKNWTIKQPQFWASILIRTKNVLMKDIYVNATSYNPESQSDEKNWLQNTDGLDTYISHNVTVENFVYQGGDDCVALKPNSTMITLRNITCYGGTGITGGSIAQYQNIVDIIDDVLIEDVKLYPSSQCPMFQGVYFKSWIGESHGLPPNGGGGGEGYGRNITVKNVYMEDVMHPVVVDTTLTYLPDVKGRTGIADSKFEWYDIHLENFTGTATGNRLFWMDCPKSLPCRGFTFKDMDGLKPGKTDHPEISYVCNNFVLAGGEGLDECHPSNSTLETDNGGTL